MLSTKDLIEIAGTSIALAVFIFGLVQYVHANAIRRYEKFHEMSVRFDENAQIQAVCCLLNKTSAGVVTKQQKEVFICFLEEVYFMLRSGIMKRDITLYTFGHYGDMALESDQFWSGLERGELRYSRFLEFCSLAKLYIPPSSVPRQSFVF